MNCPILASTNLQDVALILSMRKCETNICRYYSVFEVLIFEWCLHKKVFVFIGNLPHKFFCFNRNFPLLQHRANISHRPLHHGEDFHSTMLLYITMLILIPTTKCGDGCDSCSQPSSLLEPIKAGPGSFNERQRIGGKRG